MHAGDDLPVDLELRGNPLALLRALRNGDIEPAEHGRDPVVCTGDVHLLADVASVLRDLSPDLLAPLRDIAGNDIASALHTGGALARAAAQQLIGQLNAQLKGRLNGEPRDPARSLGPENLSTLLQNIGAALRKIRPGE